MCDASICAMRRVWRAAPENLVSSHVVMIFFAVAADMRRAGRQRTLASSSVRERRALSSLHASVARMPFVLLAAMQTPCPLPQRRMPRV